MKKIGWLISLLILVLGVLAPRPVSARALDQNDKRKIECAMFKMYALSNYFNVDMPADQKQYKYPQSCGKNLAGKTIKMPDWFPKELEAMDKLKVVYIQGEGTLSEATLWYRTFANVYAFLDRANNALDPSQPVVLEQLSRGYVSNRIKLVSNLDRLNKELVRGQEVYSMKDSMQGRGRSMLATLEFMNREFYSTIESFTSPAAQKENKYRQSVMAVVTLANQLWSEFRAAPLPANPPDAKIYQTTDGERLFSTLLMLLGAFLIGYAVYLLMEAKSDEINRGWAQYREKSMIWAEDFNRQFLTIDVKYIVFGTLAVFALMGLLMGISMGGFGGVLIFILFVIVGAYAGIRMPKVVLDKLKKSRGVKINGQLMDALILLSNSLRSGMDIVQGFELVSHDMRPQIADEFGLVIKNYQLGTPFEKALEGLDERVESRMLSYTIKAIIIQRQVGGNLTVIFSRLVENIREESKLEEKLEAMTAQQKIQSIVVSIMPVIMLGVMFLFRPDEMIGFYTTPVGIFVLFFCFVWIMIGMKLIQKLGEVRV
ncbi:MAG: type II secretion system F family protein [Elusimicrobiaceae bacterium]|nr:type II secretion system F family protein [Elusimicrobiaceae bacterium]